MPSLLLPCLMLHAFLRHVPVLSSNKCRWASCILLPTHASQQAQPQLARVGVSSRPALAAQGHLRLVLAPIVYNAMAQKACLRALPLYRALRRVLRASTYDPLLHHPPAHTLPNVVGRCVQALTLTFSECNSLVVQPLCVQRS